MRFRELITLLAAFVVCLSCDSQSQSGHGGSFPSVQYPIVALPTGSPAVKDVRMPEDAGRLDEEFVKEREHALAIFSTEYDRRHPLGPRAANISRAASRLNVTIGPGEEFSFNEAVGPRSKENGFEDAPIIFMGEVSEGVGGGVCQVSSTLHAAALFSGMEVVSRRPHTRVSKYIEKGLDATVSYPPACAKDRKDPQCDFIDLVVRNPFSFPVRVIPLMVETDERGIWSFEISILGSGKPIQEAGHKTSFSFGANPGRRFHKTGRVRSETYRKLVQKGARGENVTSIVNYLLDDGTEREVRYVSRYRPVDEVWEVGLNWDMSGPPPWEKK